jgi:ABC-type lipoprotein export system ATPase subunit
MKPTAIYTATGSGKSTLLDETFAVLRELVVWREARG